MFSYSKSMETISPRGVAKFGPGDIIGIIYNGDNQKLLHTKYRSSGPCGFRKEDLFKLFPIVSLWWLMTQGWAIFDPWGMFGTIYKGDYQTLLHTKYRSCGHCGKIFVVFPL